LQEPQLGSIKGSSRIIAQWVNFKWSKIDFKEIFLVTIFDLTHFKIDLNTFLNSLTVVYEQLDTLTDA